MWGCGHGFVVCGRFDSASGTSVEHLTLVPDTAEPHQQGWALRYQPPQLPSGLPGLLKLECVQDQQLQHAVTGHEPAGWRHERIRCTVSQPTTLTSPPALS